MIGNAGQMIYLSREEIYLYVEIAGQEKMTKDELDKKYAKATFASLQKCKQEFVEFMDDKFGKDWLSVIGLKCEACGTYAQSQLRNYDETPYYLCANCLTQLVNLCLTKKQFDKLIVNGHKDTEFYLHSDFYDEGIALQPR